MKRKNQHGVTRMELMIAAGIRTNQVSALRTIGAIRIAQAQYRSRTGK